MGRGKKGQMMCKIWQWIINVAKAFTFLGDFRYFGQLSCELLLCTIKIHKGVWDNIQWTKIGLGLACKG